MPEPPFPVRRALFWVGLLLMAVGVWLTAVFIYLVVVGGPIFLVGLGLVWASGQPVWARLLATVLPPAAWLGTAMVALALADRQPAATFLIPEGFEGHILLVLGEPCGLPPEQADGRLLYRVPASGIVISQNPAWDARAPENEYPKRGYYAQPDNEYYVVDRRGQRLRELTELAETYSDDPAAAPQTTTAWVGVGRDEVGVFPGSPFIAAPGDSVGRYTFQDFAVSSFARLHHPANSDQAYAQSVLADSLVARCRRRGAAPAGITAQFVVPTH